MPHKGGNRQLPLGGWYPSSMRHARGRAVADCLRKSLECSQCTVPSVSFSFLFHSLFRFRQLLSRTALAARCSQPEQEQSFTQAVLNYRTSGRPEMTQGIPRPCFLMAFLCPDKCPVCQLIQAGPAEVYSGVAQKAVYLMKEWIHGVQFHSPDYIRHLCPHIVHKCAQHSMSFYICLRGPHLNFNQPLVFLVF